MADDGGGSEAARRRRFRGGWEATWRRYQLGAADQGRLGGGLEAAWGVQRLVRCSSLGEARNWFRGGLKAAAARGGSSEANGGDLKVAWGVQRLLKDGWTRWLEGGWESVKRWLEGGGSVATAAQR